MGHLNIVERLIAAGANVNRARTIDGLTSLYLASKNGHSYIVERLIAAGADVNKARTNGATPLYVASQIGDLNIVERLIAAGAEVNKARTNDGATPLYVASEIGDLAIVERLIAAGADKTIRAKNGTLPIDVAKTQGIRDLLSSAIPNSNLSVNFNAPNNNAGPLYNALLIDEIAEGNILGFFPNNAGKIYPSQGILVRKATNAPHKKSAAWRSVLESGKNPFTRAPLGPPTFRKVHVKAKTRRGGRRADARTRRGRDLQRSS
jgi:ankyrin repeat protein